MVYSLRLSLSNSSKCLDTFYVPAKSFLLASRQLRKEMGKERAYTKDPNENFGFISERLVTYVALLLILGKIFSGRKR